MAKKASQREGKSLVIVESPAKARTISKFLGDDFTVEASVGHVRDLPQGAKEVPQEYKSEKWARLGVNVDDQFTPLYVVSADKKQQIAKLRKLLKESKELFLATDEDREGEAISWHLHELLEPKVPVHRLVFHEITEEAIQEALANPRSIDDQLVKAQETRRILDRLYGYEVSPLLWYKLRPKLSAGRVQSVAVRLIVERERERRAFVSATYWDLLATFATEAAQEFKAELVSFEDRKLPSGKDFDPATGKLTDPRLLLLDESGARQLAERLQSAEFRVASLEEKPYTSKPAPPFTTSTLQQEANRKLGFTARRTMSVAQSLYENGYITYMRTDSTNLAKVAVDAARDLVMSQYGREYLPDEPRIYRSKVKNAQEAHEAVRPAGHPFRLPESLRGELGPDEFRLFELIWKRTIASQMSNAQGRRIMIRIEGGGAIFQVSGRTIDFAGFLRAYVEGSDDPQAELADQETILPAVAQGQAVLPRGMAPKGHTTQPPARYSEASLTRTLEERGIGRPSTYASIIDTILERNYVFKKGSALAPTWTAFAVCRLLEEHLPNLVDYDFTAQMEEFLDAVSRGEAEHLKYLQAFYFGDGEAGLKEKIEQKVKEVDAREICQFSIGTPQEGPHREEVLLRVGRYGPYLQQGERRASVPDDLAPDELTLDKAMELLDRASQGDQPLGMHPETGQPIYLKQGRFGPYIQMGEPESEEKKNAALIKGMQSEDVTLDVAVKLLELPRVVGVHPQNGQPIEAHNGRFGPYVKCGEETRSLPADLSPLDVTLDDAVALLSQPKTRSRRQAASKEPLKVFEPSPVTGEPIKLLSGYYGPYVTDGATNASVPKGTPAEEVTFEMAVALLADRAAKAPAKKKAAKKKTAKAPAKKKAAKKKTTKKKAQASAEAAASSDNAPWEE